MNTAQIKLVTSAAAGALGLGLAVYVGLFLARKNEILATVSADRMRDVLSDVKAIPQRTVDVIEYDKVKLGLLSLDWTGKPPPPPETVVERPEGGEVAVKERVADLLMIRGVRYDAEEPGRSEVIFKYKSQARVTAPASNPDGTFLLRVGQMLHPPLDKIRIAAAYAEGVEFAFDGEPGRANEIVGPADFDLTRNNKFVRLADGTAPAAKPQFNPIAQRPDAGPVTETQQISPNRFRLGSEDARFIDENYPQILTEEVAIARHRDPTTKKFDGIEVTKLAPGSIASRHGVEEGDVIKSINGHAVTSKEEAIQFVKNNKDNYDVWEVEVWNRGQTRTITYYPPKK